MVSVDVKHHVYLLRKNELFLGIENDLSNDSMTDRVTLYNMYFHPMHVFCIVMIAFLYTMHSDLHNIHASVREIYDSINDGAE